MQKSHLQQEYTNNLVKWVFMKKQETRACNNVFTIVGSEQTFSQLLLHCFHTRPPPQPRIPAISPSKMPVNFKVPPFWDIRPQALDTP